MITLGRTEPEAQDALSLPNLILSIQSILEEEGHSQQLEKFQDALLNIGYAHSEEYSTFSYIVAFKKFYCVSGDFPRITLSNIPNGVSNVTYDLELTNCEPFLIEEPWVSAV